MLKMNRAKIFSESSTAILNVLAYGDQHLKLNFERSQGSTCKTQ